MKKSIGKLSLAERVIALNDVLELAKVTPGDVGQMQMYVHYYVPCWAN